MVIVVDGYNAPVVRRSACIWLLDMRAPSPPSSSTRRTCLTRPRAPRPHPFLLFFLLYKTVCATTQTAGNFVDLVQRGFYDGMEIQRSDGFVIQTGKPANADGFVEGGKVIGLSAHELSQYRGMHKARLVSSPSFVVCALDGPQQPTHHTTRFTRVGSAQVRTIPLEIMVKGDKVPVYGTTLEDIGRYQEQVPACAHACPLGLSPFVAFSASCSIEIDPP